MTRASRIAVIAALTLSITAVLQGAENIWLKLRMRDEWSARENRLRISAGTVVPSLHAYGTDGRPQSVNFDAQPTLLLAFSPHCGACLDNWPAWQRLEREAASAGVRTLYVNLTRQVPVEFFTQHPMHQALSEPDPRFLVTLKLALTPTTLLVTTDSIVAGAWIGVLRGASLSDAEGKLRALIPSSTRTR